MCVEEVSVRHRRRSAVRGASAEFGPGVTTVVGPNGAGKSSLFRALAGVQRPTSGRVRLGGHTPAETGRWQSLVGYLPQEPDLAGGVSVRDTVALAAWLKGLGRRQLGYAVQRAVESVGLADRAGDRVRTLSGGMRRRLGFAAAVVHEPRLLVLDEPTAGLDPEQRTVLANVITELAHGRIVVLSTHVLDDLRRFGGAVAVMSAGRIVFHGPLRGLTDAAAVRLGRALDPARPEDLDLAYLGLQDSVPA
ncbi:ATP-binding cassette domain-containing protein [Pseudonocardia hispaniensis]|uniref:ATP-binding cassette domain-containing protein n=1 Tax=Pseudonocardia hispaniensis TaxID=904933 RepID=A0ABW1J8F2_9PSEU